MDEASEQEILDMYNAGMSVSDIKRETSWSLSRIYKVLRDNDIVLNTKTVADRIPEELHKQVVEDYYNLNITMAELCATYGVSYAGMMGFLSLMGVDVSYRKQIKKSDDDEKRKVVIEMYQNGASVYEIYNATAVQATGVYKILREEGIPTRKQERMEAWKAIAQGRRESAIKASDRVDGGNLPSYKYLRPGVPVDPEVGRGTHE